MRDREFEVKLELTNEEAVFIKEKLNGQIKRPSSCQIDRYYCPEGTDSRKYMQEKCLRIRTQDGEVTLDYKEIISQHDIYMQQLIEYSTIIADAQIMDAILNQIGMRHILSVTKRRQEYIVDSIFKIALDYVEQLGFFLEIELLDETKFSENWVTNIIKELNISEIRINRMGYSNMLLDLQKEELE